MKVSRYRTYLGLAAIAIAIPLMAAAAVIERAAVFVWAFLASAFKARERTHDAFDRSYSVRHTPLEPALLNSISHERGFHRLASARGG